MENKELFRKEAQEARSEAKSLHGEVLLYLPDSYRAILIIVFLVLAILIAILFLGSYTKRVTVKGELFSTRGAIPVYLSKPGIIKQYYVAEDEVVNQDDPLFSVSSEVFGAENRGMSTETIGLLIERKNLLQRQLESEEIAYEENLRSLDGQIQSKKSEKKLINAQLGEVKKKNDLLAIGLKKYEEARLQDAISDDSMTDKTVTALNSQIDYHERQREFESTVRDIANLHFEREGAISEFGRRTLQIKGDLLALEEQILAAESQKGTIVKAPATGVVTAIQGVNGSYYDNTKPVSFILPSGSELEARLLVSAAAIGFIKKGDAVYLRYSAYPYQQFGQGKGTVYSISGTSLLPDEIALGSKLSITEPMYLVKARIETQTIKGNGSMYPLKPGLLLDADIMLEKHRIYQWLIRPFSTLSEKLK
ncbi:HlyD family secretion protein [Pseudomonas sp. EA_35y_Pfl2_R5]|uniref:HlyD family secretion protein n=1 Tax=Pseudomonas sp. EA_35y_Pfl2_R5 TaxID=3088690 RepID=UPI0030D76809